jgi:tetratricopeptide (TPR) repeat protein
VKRAALLGLAFALLGWPAVAQESEARPHGVATGALLRDLDELQHSAPERWSDWSASQPPPAELAEDLRGALRSYFAGDYAAAAQGFFGLLEREPDFPPALYQLGVTYFRLRRYGDCARALERFLSVAPKEVGATQALAHSYYSLGDYARAAAHYARVLEAKPESVEALRGLGLTEMRLGHRERALELLERCLALKPDHVEATYWKGRVLYDLGRTDEARAAAEAAIQLDPYDPRPHFLLSQVLYDLGDDEAAAASEARFLELNLVEQKLRTLEGLLIEEPRKPELYARLAEVHRSVGDMAGARAALARLVRALPEDLEARIFALGKFAELGERKDADAQAEGIERDFAEVPEAWRALRDYWASVGDTVRQVRAGERYLRLGGDPDR